MSRVAKSPIKLPKGVEINIGGNEVSVKGPKGTMAMALHPFVAVAREGDSVTVSVADQDNKDAWRFAGTTRANLSNLIHGCHEGFERKLELVGVGYRAAAKGKVLNLTLGYSHPIDYELPEGVTAETPSQTEIILKSSDKQRLGQAASEIRRFRPPEPYKGKGVRYAGERILRKEAKKK